ncbi:ATP-binding protein, partial [Streptomyces sp. SID7499]|nr:ATP-binding protein [Streptomyces sp. SID7499]
MRFAYEWESFPPEEYAIEVLARCDLAAVFLIVSDRRRLAALRHLPDLQYLRLEVDAPDAEIRAALEGKRPVHLVLDGIASLTDLSCLLPVAPTLRYLKIDNCPGLRDLAALRELTSLTTLCLDLSGLPTTQAIAADLPAALGSLELTGLAADRLSDIAPHPPVEDLALMARRPLVLDALDAWPSLAALEVSELNDWNEALTALAAFPQIIELTFHAFPWQNPPTDAPALPAIEELRLQAPRDGRVLDVVRPLFPGVTHL